MNVKAILILCIISVITPILGYNAIWFFPEKYYDKAEKFCFVTIALYPLILCFIARELFMFLNEELGNIFRWCYRVMNILMWLLVGNLIDELFCDPTQVNIWEYAFAIFVVVVNINEEIKSKGKFIEHKRWLKK